MERPDDTRTRLRALRLIEATHETGSVAAAAQLLHVSTSTVSRTLQQAERALQVTLFERGARGMVCTTPGLAVVRGCAAVRAELMLSVGDGAPMVMRQVESLFRVLTVPMLRCFVACAELANETLAARSPTAGR